jgi:hypothetical protein
MINVRGIKSDLIKNVPLQEAFLLRTAKLKNLPETAL